MKFAWIAMMVLASPVMAEESTELVPVTDKEAAYQAGETLALAKRLWQETEDVCRSDDDVEKYRIHREAAKAAHGFDTDRPINAARLPYESCESAASDVMSRIGICVNNYSTYVALRIERDWARDAAECAAAIRKPDLTLKRVP
jgi:hypothetical protein